MDIQQALEYFEPKAVMNRYTEFMVSSLPDAVDDQGEPIMRGGTMLQRTEEFRKQQQEIIDNMIDPDLEGLRLRCMYSLFHVLTYSFEQALNQAHHNGQ